MRLYCENRIPLDAERFWSELHAPRYESMAADAIGLEEYRELERSETGDTIYRRILAVPRIPHVFQGVLRRISGGSEASYVEEQWRSKQAMEVRWKVTPAFLADRVCIEGVVRVEPVDDSSCVRILDGQVVVRLPGLGDRLARAIVENTVAAYATTARVAARLRTEG